MLSPDARKVQPLSRDKLDDSFDTENYNLMPVGMDEYPFFNSENISCAKYDQDYDTEEDFVPGRVTKMPRAKVYYNLNREEEEENRDYEPLDIQSMATDELEGIEQLYQEIFSDPSSEKPIDFIADKHGRRLWRLFDCGLVNVVLWETFEEALNQVLETKITNLERKSLQYVLDQSATGSVSAHNFAEFLKGFGPLSCCLDNLRKVVIQEWFHGFLSRHETESLLYNRKPGTYLVRFSNTRVGSFAIGLQTKRQKVAHILIESNSPSKGFKILILKDGNKVHKHFDSLFSALEFYTAGLKYPLDCDYIKANWFHGDLSREEATQALTGQFPGDFLVRFSGKPGAFASSYVSVSGQISHSRIVEASNGIYSEAQSGKEWGSLSEMVESCGHILKNALENDRCIIYRIAEAVKLAPDPAIERNKIKEASEEKKKPVQRKQPECSEYVALDHSLAPNPPSNLVNEEENQYVSLGTQRSQSTPPVLKSEPLGARARRSHIYSPCTPCTAETINRKENNYCEIPVNPPDNRKISEPKHRFLYRSKQIQEQQVFEDRSNKKNGGTTQSGYVDLISVQETIINSGLKRCNSSPSVPNDNAMGRNSVQHNNNPRTANEYVTIPVDSYNDDNGNTNNKKSGSRNEYVDMSCIKIEEDTIPSPDLEDVSYYIDTEDNYVYDLEQLVNT